MSFIRRTFSLPPPLRRVAVSSAWMNDGSVDPVYGLGGVGPGWGLPLPRPQRQASAPNTESQGRWGRTRRKISEVR
jgi:hypothetical protein